MIHTQQIIQDAIDGGWKPCDIIHDYRRIIVSFTHGGVWIKNDPDEDGCHHDLGRVFLDPLFWQAVGKARGWKYVNPSDGREPWLQYWRFLIDQLAEGDDYEAALSKLT